MVEKASDPNQFRAVLDIAENALTVAHLVTTDIWWADPEMSAVEARDFMLASNFDASPLRDEPTRRYVHINDLQTGLGRVKEVARPIEVSNLVTSSLSLTKAVAALKQRAFFFVLEGNHLLGIVTRSDLQRPAVGMVIFSISLAAEAGLTQLVQRSYRDDWFHHLSQGRQDYVTGIFDDRRRLNAEISRLDCMMLEDRLTLVAKRPELRRQLGFVSRRQFEDWADTLKNLRNTLAHGGDLLDVQPQPVEAIELFEKLAAFAETVYGVVSQGPP